MKVIFYSSPTGSIGEISKDLLKSFNEKLKGVEFISIKKDHKFDIVQTRDKKNFNSDIFLSHFIPEEIILDSECFNSAKHKILIQPIDGTQFTKSFTERINRFDHIITPSRASKEIMLGNGVLRSISIIPNYFHKTDLEISDYQLPKKLNELLKDKFVFYHESTHHPRKGVDYMYEAFVREFSNREYTDKVILLSKDSAYNKITYEKNEEIKSKIIKIQKEQKKPAKILKLSQELNFEELKSIWNRVDAYVGFSKIEGFGIPFLRMSALGKPIVALNGRFNGYLDFLNKHNSYLSNGSVQIAKEEFMSIYDNETRWVEPYLYDCQVSFRELYQDFLKGNLKTVNVNEIEKYEFEIISNKYVIFLKKYLNR